MVSSRGTPLEICSWLTRCCKPSEVTGKNAESVLVDQEWVFVGAVRRAAVFHDAKPSGGDLVGHAMVEENNAIGDVLFESVTGECPFAAFGGNHGGDSLVFQPAEQAAQFSTQNALVLESGEQVLDCVENHALRADTINGGTETDEESLQIVIAGLVDLAAFHANVIEGQLFFIRQFIQVETSERTFCVSSAAVSSNAMKTPGSPYWVAPRTRNSMARRVLPAPALPHTRVGRPRGSPPPVISSSP